MTSVTVVDYGVGNLLSVRRAFEHLDCEVVLTGSADRIAVAERLVLPGVGAFGDCIGELDARGLIEPVLDFVRTGRPLLGICVGMQMLFEGSDEFGEHRGLCLLPGRVSRIPTSDRAGNPIRVPHIGWSPLLRPVHMNGEPAGTFLAGSDFGASVYFVHSFAALPDEATDTLAEVDYGGHRVMAAVARGNIMGSQFHPEKSGKVGLAMLRRFAGG